MKLTELGNVKEGGVESETSENIVEHCVGQKEGRS